jgi:hypothetical protein
VADARDVQQKDDGKKEEDGRLQASRALHGRRESISSAHTSRTPKSL